jgi:uncharacterized membrane protein (DUF373 family)
MQRTEIIITILVWLAVMAVFFHYQRRIMHEFSEKARPR